ncbi:MAG: MBL fold metallo-hydrolase [Acidobacteria bacterium]|nr:MBL fold metallo-hydrolase [Acidobacteriota bacterium]
MAHRAVWIRGAALGLALSGLWIAHTQQAPPEPLDLQHVKGPLHALIGSGGNVSVLVTDEGVVLGDDKFDRNFTEIVAKVKTLSDKPIRFDLNTHHHGDHTGGNEQMLSQGTEVIAHENARANLVRGQQKGPQPLTFSEQLTVHAGGEEVRAIYFGRGHTNGDVVLYYPKLRAIHTGDLFVTGAPFIDYANGGSAVEWDDTLNAVLQLEFDTVIPGHGAVSTRDDLVQWKENFETYRERVSELSRAGKSAEEAIAAVKVDDLKGWSKDNRLKNGMAGLLQELR